MQHSRAARSGLRQLAVALQPQVNSSWAKDALQPLQLPAACSNAVELATRAFSSNSSISNAQCSSWRGSWSAGASSAALVAAAAAAAAAAGTAVASSTGGQDEQPQAVQHDHQQQWQQQQQQQQQQGALLSHLLASSIQCFAAAADAPQQQQQQQQRTAWATGPGGEPLSGAIALLDEDGLTNHPLDYNPITNEHTATMTLAKQAGLEAYQAGRYAEAEKRFKEALVEAKAGFPANDPHIPSAMHYLAEFYRNVGRLDDAEPLYRETITQLHDNLGERHWMYSAALCSLAALHEARGEYTQAIELLESALELRRQLFSNSSFLYADTAALLANTLMQQHTAAVAAAAVGTTGSSGSSGGGWFGRGGSGKGAGKTAAASPSVLRAIKLWQTAIQIVEDSGSVVHSPVVPWLLDMASAQQSISQHTAAVTSLQKTLEYMALPQQQEQQENSSTSSSQQQQQQPGASIPTSSSSSSSSSSSGDGIADSQDTMTAVMNASGGNMELARLKLSAMASETAERLVDAQLAACDLQGARHTLRQALEARIALLGRHLVVAKTMTRLANLLMQKPMDPSAPQLAPHFASSAVAIADTALQNAQRTNLWRGMMKGALKVVQTASLGGYKAGVEAERTSDRLVSAIQLGQASLSLAAAEKMNGRLPEAESALRHGVTELRWVLGVGTSELQRLTGSKVESALLQRIGGMMVDLKLLQMDCLEALAATIKEQASVASTPSSARLAKQAKAAQPPSNEPAEVASLLAEADKLAVDLVAE